MHLPDNTLLQGGKYRITRFISSGGFGNTYEGVHTMMDTRIAIKEFFPKMFCNRDENTSHVTVATNGNRELVDKLRKKFNEEAKAVFKMNHPNIVRVLDIFEENGTAYYVMDYIDGKSLNEMCKQRGALPESEAVGYIRQIADALKYVHSLNRLHLDIKPGNIMVDSNGKAILIDFGASKHYDDESGENTSTLMGVNTKGYAPTEQMNQSFTSFSPATDIYSLGATLYKLLSGVTPPDANLLLAEEETLNPLPATISGSTRNAVMAAMALRRKDRIQDIEAFLSLLNADSGKQEKEPDAETTICEILEPNLGSGISLDNVTKTDSSEGGVEEKPQTVKAPAKENALGSDEDARSDGMDLSRKADKESFPNVGDEDKNIQKRDEKTKSTGRRNLFWVITVFSLFIALLLGSIFLGENHTKPLEFEKDIPEFEFPESKVQYVTDQTFQDVGGKTYSYTGEILNGLPNGQGKGIYPYGVYTGEYKDGLRHGRGNYETKDGENKYVGTFLNDKYDQGKLTLSDGYYFDGQFKNEQPYNGKWYNKKGEVDTEIVNGK